MEYFIINILFWHWLADFYFQTNEMATNKSTSNYWLTRHILMYGLILFFGALTLVPLDNFTIYEAFTWTLVNMMFHWITDYFTSRWTSSLWKQERIHDFFVVIGIDQFLHSVVLILSFSYLLYLHN